MKDNNNWKHHISSAIEALKRAQLQATAWARRHIPPGLRTLVGLALIVGGIFGFLPVLGF